VGRSCTASRFAGNPSDICAAEVERGTIPREPSGSYTEIRDGKEHTVAEVHEIALIVAHHKDRLLEMSDRIWDCPELRWEEYTAVAEQIAVAEAEGFTVLPELTGIPTAFAAEAGSGGPVIAILGEYDALAELSQAAEVTEPTPAPGNLSGNGHGCGHNLLGAGSLLAAIAVKDYLAAHDLPGRVRYYGCPAEEGGGGKTYLVCRGAFDDVDAAFSWHPGYGTGVSNAAMLVSVQAYFRFTGRPAHAATSPDLGRSALDAVELMNIGVNYLREHMPDDARVHYAVTDTGGRSPNVVQAHAESLYFVRHPKLSEAYDLFERVKKIAAGAALMTGTSWSFELESVFSEVLHNDTLNERLQQHLEAAGELPFDDADQATAARFNAALSATDHATMKSFAGAGGTAQAPLPVGIRPLATTRAVVHGSTDVADVSQVTPTAQIGTPCWVPGTPPHSWLAVAQGKTSYARKATAHAATVLATATVDLLQDADLLARVQAEHAEHAQESPYQRVFGPDALPTALRANRASASPE
jgi:aminobenzoyl-glutamate utilization protein B